jgi:hypothetical protein
VLRLKYEKYLHTHTHRERLTLFSLGLSSFRVRKQLVNVPSYIVRLDSQKHIDFSLKSPFGGGKYGRTKRRKLKRGEEGEEEEDED